MMLLHYVVTKSNIQCIRVLANLGANLNARKFGADLNACNQRGKTPFELLPNSSSSESTAQIIIREAVKREALCQSLCEGYKQMAQSCENYSLIDQECREEVKPMQSENIDIEDSVPYRSSTYFLWTKRSSQH